MSNSARGGRAKHPDDWYYDQLGPRVRKALQESAYNWSSKWCLTHVKSHGADYVISEIRRWDQYEFKKKRQAKAFEKGSIVSTVIACKVPPLRANW